jgi:phosphate:Na+ symporter
MKEIIFGTLEIAGALGIFIYGMKLMSEGLQKVAGNKMREILKGMTKNRFLGIITGFIITALIQSSSATTVMVVSFVNAGLLTLTESFGVIMGANIGTTITLWIVAILGFKVKMTYVAIALIGVFFPFMFSSKDKYKNIAEFVLGFGILFIGLDFLKHSVPDIKNNPEMVEFLKHFVDLGPMNYGSIMLFVLFGTLLTIIVQSSSAASAITLTLVMKGWIPFDLGAAMILGENIGTTITANLAALVANPGAQRSARFHFLFNMIGVVWILIFFIPFTNMIENLMGAGHFDALAETAGKGNEGMALALFHTMFNILNVIILFAFVPMMGKLVYKMIPVGSDEDEEFKLQHISTGLMSTPGLSIMEAKKELVLFAKLINKMSNNVFDLFFETQKKPQQLIEKIREREDITDRMDLELTDFLTKVAESDLTKETSSSIHRMMSISNDLERIADIYFEITKNYERLKKENVELPANAKEEIKDIMTLVMQAIKFMRNNLDESNDQVSEEDVIAIENQINAKQKEIFVSHFSRLEKGVYSPKQGVLFIDFVKRAERIGDHIINVQEAIYNKSSLYKD